MPTHQKIQYFSFEGTTYLGTLNRGMPWSIDQVYQDGEWVPFTGDADTLKNIILGCVVCEKPTL